MKKSFVEWLKFVTIKKNKIPPCIIINSNMSNCNISDNLNYRNRKLY